ncbi:MAG: hypothetical protein H5T83_05105, partial [Actinotalea sp.]|nr:hypothetical protein [Actinotalea sp.]
ELVRAALASGGRDNVSVVVVDVARVPRAADLERTADAGRRETGPFGPPPPSTRDEPVDVDTVPRRPGPEGGRTPEVLP